MMSNKNKTRFDVFKLMTLDQLTEWLDKYGQSDGSWWMDWFDKKYCKNCEAIMCSYENRENEFPCSYCEINNKCKFFPNIDHAPNNKEIIKMWLESED